MSTPHPEQLIDPYFFKVAAAIKTATPEQLARPHAQHWTFAPPRLLPFLQTPSLATLVNILEADPRMYWHPHVYRQIRYLLRLLDDKVEWLRQRWEWDIDEETDLEGVPEEVGTVREWLTKLVEAHLRGLFPRRRVVWKSVPKRAGRKRGLKGVPTDPVDAAILAEDFEMLRTAFKAQMKAIGRKVGPTKAEAKARYRQLAKTVLEEMSASARVGWWSHWKEYETVVWPDVPPPVNYTCPAAPTMPFHPQEGDLRLDTSTKPYVLKKYDASAATWTTFGEIWAKDVSQGLAIVDALHQPITERTIEHWKP